MRKYLALLLAVAMLLTLVACGGDESNSSEPTTTDPVVTDPITTDPTYTYPTVDPNYTYPSYTDPIYTTTVTDPMYTYPTTQPSYTYPIITDPIVTDPTVTEPVMEEPTSTSSTERTTTSLRRPMTTYRPRTTTGKGDVTQPTAPIATDSLTPGVTEPTTPGVTEPGVTEPGATDPSTAPTTPVTPGTPAADHEEPDTSNGAIKWDPQSSSIDAKAEEMRQKILNMPDTIKPSTDGVTYYVSFKGNDANDGLSPETAWRSTYRVGQLPALIRTNSTLLFERGGVYRGQMEVRDGMSIGAYGTGPKPQLYGGPKNFADESYWTQTDTPNVWKTEVGKGGTKTILHIGNIIFNHGEEYASPGLSFGIDELDADFEYYHDIKNEAIYLYHSKGNPGGAYDSIEMSPRGAVLRRYSSDTTGENITIENLCIRYSAFGISFATVENMKISGCEIGNIGGSISKDYDVEKGDFVPGEMVRYGNGIEFFGNQKSALVENNWIYQCFDAGYTNQGGEYHENITVRNNLLEYSPYNIEAWTRNNGTIANTVFENNIMRFSGFGFGTYQRIGSGTGLHGHINTGSGPCGSDNFVIRNNIFDTGKHGLISSHSFDGTKGPKYEGNTWIQQSNYPVLRAKMPGSNSVQEQPGGSLAAMKAAILPIDPTAKIIYE